MKLTRCWAFKIWTRTDLTDADIPEFLKPKFSFLFALSLFSDEDDSWFFLYLCPKSSNGVPRRKGVARYFDTVQPHQRPNSNRTRVIRKSKYKYQQQLQFFGSSIFIRVVFFYFFLAKNKFTHMMSNFGHAADHRFLWSSVPWNSFLLAQCEMHRRRTLKIGKHWQSKKHHSEKLEAALINLWWCCYAKNASKEICFWVTSFNVEKNRRPKDRLICKVRDEGAKNSNKKPQFFQAST